MNRLYFEEFPRRVTADAPCAVFYRENINYVAHVHDEIEIGIVLSGEIRTASESGEARAREGDLFVFMPDVIHGFSSPESSRAYILRILPPSDAPDFSLLRLKQGVFRANEACYSVLRDAIFRIVREDEARGEGWELVVRKECCEIFLTVLRDLPNVRILPEERNRLSNRTALLRSVNAVIEERYGDAITLDEAAAECGYSKYYFSHCIKQITGMTFLEFLTLYRLDRARAQMRESDRTVTEIALSCGFTNLRSFHRAFRKYYKTTPTEFRRAETESDG